jgi:hypothetical protein
MNKFLKIALFLCVLSTTLMICSCSSTAGRGKKTSVAANTDSAVISFKEYERELGKVTQGEKVASIFTFENKGKGPLVIMSATTSCGCTVTKYDTRPINPGDSGTLEVVFDSSGREGKQSKTIVVSSNASKPTVLLRISCEVINSTNN